MWKRYDWECSKCGDVIEPLTNVAAGESPPKTMRLRCDRCGAKVEFTRLPSLCAKPSGAREAMATNIDIAGGKWDTAGYKPLPKLPVPAWVGEHQREVESRVDEMTSAGASKREMAAELDRPIGRYDYGGLFGSKEWKEASRERKARDRENKAKRKRMEMIKRGETTLRDCPLPGDPPLAKKGSSDG